MWVSVFFSALYLFLLPLSTRFEAESAYGDAFRFPFSLCLPCLKKKLLQYIGIQTFLSSQVWYAQIRMISSSTTCFTRTSWLIWRGLDSTPPTFLVCLIYSISISCSLCLSFLRYFAHYFAHSCATLKAIVSFGFSGKELLREPNHGACWGSLPFIISHFRCSSCHFLSSLIFQAVERKVAELNLRASRSITEGHEKHVSVSDPPLLSFLPSSSTFNEIYSGKEEKMEEELQNILAEVCSLCIIWWFHFLDLFYVHFQDLLM